MFTLGPYLILFKGVDLLQERPKEHSNEPRHMHLVNYWADHLLPIAGGSLFIYLFIFSCRSYLENTASSPSAASLRIWGTRPRRPGGGSRAGVVRQLLSATVPCCREPRCPRVVPLRFLSLSVRDSGSPVPLPGVLSSPCPGRARRGPYPLTPRCTMPDQSPRACEPQRPCPWAETGGGRAGSRGGERSRFRAPVPAPRAPRELPPQTPAPLGPAARRFPRRPRRRSHGGSS